MQAIKKDVSTLTAENAALTRELRGTQEMLAHVLLAINQPVVVTRELVERGIPENLRIQIDDNIETDTFTFYIVDEDQDDDNVS
jgi:hypothetical protein